jgi:hypothetical protein
MSLSTRLICLMTLIILVGCENASETRKNPLKKFKNDSCHSKQSIKNSLCMSEIQFKEVSQDELVETVMASPELFKIKPGDQYIEKTNRAFRQSMDCEAVFVVRKTFLRAELPHLYILTEFLPESKFFSGEKCKVMNPKLPKRFIMKSSVGPDISSNWANLKSPKFYLAQDTSGYFKISGKIKTDVRDLTGKVFVYGNLSRSYFNLIESIHSKAYFRNNLMNIYILNAKEVHNIDLTTIDYADLETIDSSLVKY